MRLVRLRGQVELVGGVFAEPHDLLGQVGRDLRQILWVDLGLQFADRVGAQWARVPWWPAYASLEKSPLSRSALKTASLRFPLVWDATRGERDTCDDTPEGSVIMDARLTSEIPTALGIASN